MTPKLQIIGLSGGIATGKSTCAKILSSLVSDLVLFDADDCVKNLYQSDVVLMKLKGYFGSQVITKNGAANKQYLRSKVFANKLDKRFLEELFHPLVREECLALLEQTATKGVSPLFVADVPLLFENGFDFGQSINVLVATSKKTQVERLVKRNNWDTETVQSVLSSQMPIHDKHSLADVVFWNEGGQDLLLLQCRRFLQSLSIQYN